MSDKAEAGRGKQEKGRVARGRRAVLHACEGGKLGGESGQPRDDMAVHTAMSEPASESEVLVYINPLFQFLVNVCIDFRRNGLLLKDSPHLLLVLHAMVFDRKAQHSPLAFSGSSAQPIMNHKLHIYTHEGQLFTSFNASLPPAVIPPIPRPWNPALESDSSSDNIKDVLTTQWAYEMRPWFPLIPTNPVFDGAVFSCLNHLFYSLPIESMPDGCYILCGDVRRQWETLEHKLLWCQG
ncbi:hypothetical protein EDD22DRAFT_856274 [Suillus occidentalis]|nr:hypothetical protein EDD22DRAFT_856274 [Suillus occidentalis]